MRLGLAWGATVAVSLALGRLLFGLPLLTLVLAAVAAIAAMQAIEAWDPPAKPMLRGAAGLIALAVGCSAIVGARALGGTVLVAVGLAVLVGLVQATRRTPVLATVAMVLQVSLPVGLVAASVELTASEEIGAVIVLLAMVLAFDVGDFIVGSGAASVIEGPIAGGLMIALVTAVAAIVQSPPFGGAVVWLYGLAAMVLCPAGQIAVSWILPDAYARASAMRRLDSLVFLAPFFAVTIGFVGTP